MCSSAAGEYLNLTRRRESHEYLNAFLRCAGACEMNGNVKSLSSLVLGLWHILLSWYDTVHAYDLLPLVLWYVQ